MAGVTPLWPPETPTAATPGRRAGTAVRWIAISTRTTFVHPSRTPIAAHAGPAELPAYGEDERGTGNALEHLIRARLCRPSALPGTYRGASDQYVIELDDESWADGLLKGVATQARRERVAPLASPPSCSATRRGDPWDASAFARHAHSGIVRSRSCSHPAGSRSAPSRSRGTASGHAFSAASAASCSLDDSDKRKQLADLLDQGPGQG